MDRYRDKAEKRQSLLKENIQRKQINERKTEVRSTSHEEVWKSSLFPFYGLQLSYKSGYM